MESDTLIKFDDLEEEDKQHLVICISRIEKGRRICLERGSHIFLVSAQEAMDTLCRELHEKYR